MGPPSSGKTKFCLDKILEFETQKNNINNKILFLVPEQSTLQAEKDLINNRGVIINTQVLSFNRLCFYIFSELGGTKKILLEDIGKNMLIKKILFESKLNFFDGVKKRPGFIDNLSSIISEFYKYNISPDELNKCFKEFNLGSLKIKLEDLYLIYNKYDSYIKKKYLSLDNILDVLAEKIPESEYLDKIKIFIDGFDSFNPQEYKVLNKLMQKASIIFFCASISLDQGHKIKYKNLNIIDPFYEMKNTVNNLSDLAKENNLNILEPLSIKKVYKNNVELEFLINNFLSPDNKNKKSFTQPVKNIFLYYASNIYDEIKFIARKIICYVKSGLRFKDIVIITNDVNNYATQIEMIFKLYSIPFFIDKKFGIMTNQLVNFIQAAFDIIIYNFSYESVFCFLKTGLLGLDLDDIDLLENYVLEFGIKKDLWQKDWHLGFYNNKYDEKEINNIKKLVCEKFDFLIKNLSLDLNHKYKTSWLCEFIFDMLEHFDIKNKLLAYKNKLDENLKVWNKICLVLEKIFDIFGDEIISLKKFARILDEGLKKIDLGLIPEFTDQIIIGDIKRTRINNIKVLFIMGAVEGFLNNQEDNNQIINDDEKIFLNSFGIKLSRAKIYKLFKNDFLLYNLISKASYQINLSCYLKNNNEVNTYPDEIFNKIKSLFANINIIKGDKKNNSQDQDQDKKIIVSKDILGDAIKIIFNQESNRTQNQIEIYNWLREDLFFKSKILKLEHEILDLNLDHINSDIKLLNPRYENKNRLNISASQLEKFSRCPFAYFLKYDLNLKPKKIYELKSIDLGIFLHDVLKEFFDLIKKNNMIFKCKKNLADYINIAIKNSNFNKNIFSESAYYRFLLTHVKNILYNSINAMLDNIYQEKYIPDSFELEFNNIKLDLDLNQDLDQEIYLNGKIDRVDLLDLNSEKYLRVIDYKSKEKNFSPKNISDGLDLQLLIYLKALCDQKAIKPGGAFYFNLSDPFIKIKSNLSKCELEQKIKQKFNMSGTQDKTKIQDLINLAINKSKSISKQIISGNININPYDKKICAYCDYYSICQKQK